MEKFQGNARFTLSLALVERASSVSRFFLSLVTKVIRRYCGSRGKLKGVHNNLSRGFERSGFDEFDCFRKYGQQFEVSTIRFHSSSITLRRIISKKLHAATRI